MNYAEAKLERKIRMAMTTAICHGPMNECEQRIIQESEKLTKYILRLCTMYFWIGIGSMALGQLIYRVLL